MKQNNALLNLVQRLLQMKAGLQLFCVICELYSLISIIHAMSSCVISAFAVANVSPGSATQSTKLFCMVG